ncbi:hypothetical protein JXB11_02925 [Candidatus Woesearchaeota archaeon]|nr:hypothetical protein [Candidatus Woesearchaeota archaeon]
MKKKAVFFTFSALLLLTVAFTGILFQTRYSVSEENELVSFKTSSLNSFVLSLDQDIERGLFIAGFRALISADQVVSGSGEFLNDSESAIREAMVNGTINGKSVSMMNQSTIGEWLSRIESEATKMGIIVNFSYVSLEINQTNPWEVGYKATIIYNVTDFTGTADFRREGGVETEVSIDGLKDPLYTVFTSGKIIRAINMTAYEGNYVSGVDTTNLKEHINSLMYANSSGPSYLMRLEGNLGNSSVGIESIVRLPDLQEQGLPVYERSCVDYIYFGNDTPEIYVINNTFEDWLRIDDAHLEKYRVEGVAE